MNLQIMPAPVRRSISVKATPERAFDVFTGRMITWWRPDHHLGKSPLADVIVEPWVGGRWYERCVDGSECEWGKVLIWEPPHRVVFAWQLNAEWRFDPNFLTEVDVRFVANGSMTRVDLEHRHLDRYGDKATDVRAALDAPDGWSGGLAAYGNAIGK